MSSSVTPNPRKRVEAKAYRTRDRCDNGWFRHDDATPGTISTNAAPTTPRGRQAEDSEDWFFHNPPSDEAVLSRVTLNEKDQCQKNRDKIYGTEESWSKYDHAPELWYEEDTSESSSCRSGTDRLRDRELNSNTNDWYRHEHTVILDELNEGTFFTSTEDLSDVEDTPVPTPNKLASNCGVGMEESVLTPHQCSTREAKVNCQRDRNGSSDNWFSHDHLNPEVSISTPVHTKAGRVGEYTMRRTPDLRQESGDWFNHDANRHFQSPRPSPRGTSAIARELIYKSRSGEEMQKIMYMDENTSVTMLPCRTLSNQESELAKTGSVQQPIRISNGISSQTPVSENQTSSQIDEI